AAALNGCGRVTSSTRGRNLPISYMARAPEELYVSINLSDFVSTHSSKQCVRRESVRLDSQSSNHEKRASGQHLSKGAFMNVPGLIGAGIMLCMLAVEIRAGDEKDNPKVVVGKWKVVKASPGTFPLGTILDLSKDDKVKVTTKREAVEVIHEGTYKVDGAKII